jgi:hypothetical protein
MNAAHYGRNRTTCAYRPIDRKETVASGLIFEELGNGKGI